MKLLQEVQEDLDAESPEVESVSPVLSSRDMEVLGEYLAHQKDADEEKAVQAARVLFSIRQTSLIDVFLSNMENSAIVEELIEKYLDEDGNPKPLKVKDGNMNRLTTSGGNISDTDIFRHPGNLFGVLFFYVCKAS